MKANLIPYLLFNGDCKEAFELYQSVLGGKLTMSTFGESGQPNVEKFKDQIIHASIDNDRLTIMGSDSGDHPVDMGNNVNLSINGKELDELTNVFNKLSEGGEVKMPLAKQFWGDTFGMVKDKFGIHWMVNIEGEKK